MPSFLLRIERKTWNEAPLLLLNAKSACWGQNTPGAFERKHYNSYIKYIDINIDIKIDINIDIDNN